MESNPEVLSQFQALNDINDPHARAQVAQSLLHIHLPYYGKYQHDPVNGLQHNDGSCIARTSMAHLGNMGGGVLLHVLRANFGPARLTHASNVFGEGNAIYVLNSGSAENDHPREKAPLDISPLDIDLSPPANDTMSGWATEYTGVVKGSETHIKSYRIIIAGMLAEHFLDSITSEGVKGASNIFRGIVRDFELSSSPKHIS